MSKNEYCYLLSNFYHLSVLLDINQVQCLDMSSFCPISTVESAVSDGFSQMF